MRKKALKKKYPARHKLIMALRNNDNLIEFISKEGHSIYLNIMKHVMFNKPYKNLSYQKEMMRHINEMSKKMKEATNA